MKLLSDTVSKFNALASILELFSSKEPVPLSIEEMVKIKTSLLQADIECEDLNDVVSVLEILKQMGLITLDKHKLDEETGWFYMVGNNYNGN